MKKFSLFLPLFLLLFFAGCNTPEQNHLYEQLNLLFSFCAIIAMFISWFYSYKLFSKKVSVRLDLILYALFILSFGFPIISLGCMIYSIIWCRKKLNTAEKIEQDIEEEIDNKDRKILSHIVSIITLIPTILFTFLIISFSFDSPNSSKNIGNWLAVILFIVIVSCGYLWFNKLLFSPKRTSDNGNKKHIKFNSLDNNEQETEKENNTDKQIIIFVIESIIFLFLFPASAMTLLGLGHPSVSEEFAISMFILFWIAWASFVISWFCSVILFKKAISFRKDLVIYLFFLPIIIPCYQVIALPLMIYNIIWCIKQLRKGPEADETNEVEIIEQPKKEASKKIIREFFDAILEQDEIKIQELLNEFPELAKTPSEANGNSALHVCAVNNYTRVADLILACDDTARSCTNNDGEYPYEIAIAKGYNQLAQKLR